MAVCIDFGLFWTSTSSVMFLQKMHTAMSSCDILSDIYEAAWVGLKPILDWFSEKCGCLIAPDLITMKEFEI